MSELNTERTRTEIERLEAKLKWIESELGKTTGSAHPICQNAVDQEKCERFVARLEDVSNNIDPRKT